MTRNKRPWKRSKKQSAHDKVIAAELGNPKVDEARAAELIEQGIAEVQAKWDELDELNHRVIPASGPVEIAVVVPFTGRHGVREGKD